jgi:hypothetical protein
MDASPADEARIAALEGRLRLLEDRLEILQLIASYGPAVDSRSARATAALWADDGSYDFGGPPLVGAEAVGDLVNLGTHTAYVARGCAHVLGMPMVTITGDSAIATGYSRVYLREGDGWKVERTSANRWNLVRTVAGWKVQSRVNRLLDGRAEARALLRAGLVDAGVEGDAA